MLVTTVLTPYPLWANSVVSAIFRAFLIVIASFPVNNLSIILPGLRPSMNFKNLSRKILSKCSLNLQSVAKFLNLAAYSWRDFVRSFDVLWKLCRQILHALVHKSTLKVSHYCQTTLSPVNLARLNFPKVRTRFDHLKYRHVLFLVCHSIRNEVLF